MSVPGLIISAPNSGSGKTIFTLALLRALNDSGIKVQPFKNGPDYIDPMFHKIAANRNSYNLDTWGMDANQLNQIISISTGTDLIVSEGSMGLFDGVLIKGRTGNGATSDLSEKFGWPIILVINVSGQAQSAAASALGFMNYNKNLNFAGVILNFVSSKRHENLISDGMKKVGINILGSIPRQKELVLPERHLGLVQANEIQDIETKIQNYSHLIKDNIDLQKIVECAGFKNFKKLKPKDNNPPAQRIAIAKDKAFSFIYPHLIDNWKKAGAEITSFSPLNNEIPDNNSELIWLPGGYPELYAKEISNADKTIKSIHNYSKTKKIHGECGGYMVLGKYLIDKDGKKFKMFDLLGLVTSFKKRKLNLGYRMAKLRKENIHHSKNKIIYGHEFHYTSIIDQPDQPLYEVYDATQNIVNETGSIKENVSGTFFHYLAVAN